MEFYKNITLSEGTERFKETSNQLICSLKEFNFSEFGIYFLIPFVIFLCLVAIYYYKNQIKDYIESLFINKGFIKIYLLSNSKRLKTIIKKLDKYKRFSFKKKSYSLEEMESYITTKGIE